MRVTQCGWLLSTLGSMALATSTAAAANLLANPGFESPITFDGAPFVGSWEGFNGGAGSFAANDTTSPRTGTQDLNLTINNTDNTFAGAFQDVPVVAGQTGIWSIWAKAQSLPLGLDVEMRIEWRNSVSSTEISRTQIVPTALTTTQYQQFNVIGIVPAGADTARVVYDIQTFTGGASNTGTVFADDASFQAVPEPASMLLVSMASMLGLGARRRR